MPLQIFPKLPILLRHPIRSQWSDEKERDERGEDRKYGANPEWTGVAAGGVLPSKGLMKRSRTSVSRRTRLYLDGRDRPSIIGGNAQVPTNAPTFPTAAAIP